MKNYQIVWLSPDKRRKSKNETSNHFVALARPGLKTKMN
jgi:hypothetical protein